MVPMYIITFIHLCVYVWFECCVLVYMCNVCMYVYVLCVYVSINIAYVITCPTAATPSISVA